jgi:hypothetical protein
MISAQYLDADSMSEVISGVVSGTRIDVEDDYEIKSANQNILQGRQ